MAITQRTINTLLTLEKAVDQRVAQGKATTPVSQAQLNAIKRAYNHFTSLGHVPPPAVLQAARNLGIIK